MVGYYASLTERRTMLTFASSHGLTPCPPGEPGRGKLESRRARRFLSSAGAYPYPVSSPRGEEKNQRNPFLGDQNHDVIENTGGRAENAPIFDKNELATKPAKRMGFRPDAGGNISRRGAVWNGFEMFHGLPGKFGVAGMKECVSGFGKAHPGRIQIGIHMNPLGCQLQQRLAAAEFERGVIERRIIFRA